jgi:hypothetical protein
MCKIWCAAQLTVVVVGLFASHAHGQAVHDQIAIVIPAVEHSSADFDSADAVLMSFIVGQNIGWYFVREEGQKKFNKSAIVTVTAPLKDARPASIAALARINGAQIAVVMKAFRRLDGTLIHAVMSIPTPYRDFRTDPVEILNLEFDGKRLALDVPSRYVVFPSLFVTSEIMKLYKDGRFREICKIDQCKTDQSEPKVTGNCLRIGVDIPFSAVLRYVEKGQNSIIRRPDGCYLHKLPNTPPVSQPVIDFIGGVGRYFVGDWDRARSRMLAVIDSKADRQSNIVLEAYLYLARASLKLGNLNDATSYLQSAYSINEKDARVIETKRFLDFASLVRAVNSNSLTQKREILARIENDLAREPNFLRKRYEEILGKLKARVSGG